MVSVRRHDFDDPDLLVTDGDHVAGAQLTSPPYLGFAVHLDHAEIEQHPRLGAGGGQPGQLQELPQPDPVVAHLDVAHQPPMADIGRSGWRKSGSSMPWPAFFPRTATCIRTISSASLAPARNGVRRSDSSRANRQVRS